MGENSQCAICKQLMDDPAKIGGAKSRHLFCKLCLQQWALMDRQSDKEKRVCLMGRQASLMDADKTAVGASVVPSGM